MCGSACRVLEIVGVRGVVEVRVWIPPEGVRAVCVGEEVAGEEKSEGFDGGYGEEGARGLD